MAAMNSWGVYLIASASLILLLAPTIYKTSNNARIASDWREVDGVRTVIDSLRPGLSVQVKLWMNSTDAIRLQGYQISCNDGSGILTGRSAWLLPDYTLVHGTRYLLTLDGSRVEVTQVG
jgi:hypothetical protein